MLDGILLIDKPRGMTSFDVIRKISKKIGAAKIGHAGTLDPDASGLLILCLGQATKISQYMLLDKKEYEVDFELGVETNTFDSTGEVVAKNNTMVTREQFEASLPSFTGNISQQVPVFSAVKVQGKKLYEYARNNQAVEAPVKQVTIYSITMREFNFPHGKMSVVCSKGTYVRSLIHDLGKKLGVGAVTTHIRRVQSGHFCIGDAMELETLLSCDGVEEEMKKKLLSLDKAVSFLEKLMVPAAYLPLILHGTGLTQDQLESAEVKSVNRVLPSKGEVVVCNEDGAVLALAEISGKNGLGIKRLLVSVC